MRRLFMLLVAALLIMAGTAHASGEGVTWRGEYYNNLYLIGEPVAVLETNAVSFDWGSGAPVLGVNPDNFTVRWVTTVSLNAGTYRFFARADDEVRVTVDGATIIDTINQQRVGDLLSADVALGAGTHSIQVDYREVTGDAYVFVSWENAAGNPMIPNFGSVTTTTTVSVDVGGWTAQYYGNANLSGLPTAILSETTISRNWELGSPLPSVPVDNFSARWSASPTLQSGIYRITARADDGVRVYVDGQLQIDQWQNAVGQEASRDLNITGGLHNIIVEYREVGFNAYIEFDIVRLGTVIATPIPAVKVPSIPPSNLNATGTVDAYRLNVRAAPTTDAAIVIKVERGETYPIIGRNADSSWWQMNINGTIGWAYADFIIDTNTGNVPVTSTSSTQPVAAGTGFFATATGSVNLRSTPSRAGAVLGVLPRGATAEILGRNSTATWVQINYNGTVAWVSRSFIRTDVEIDTLPLGQ